MCMVAVTAAGGKSRCEFETESRGAYNATLYCRTIENWFYASEVAEVTAPDNGGTPVKMTLTFGKAIDAACNNADVLNMCRALAVNL